MTLWVLAALLAVLPASAREEIQSYDFDIAVASTGVVEIAETIVVKSEATDIKHGIFLNLPETLVGDDGSMTKPEIEVLSVTRNGKTEPFHTEDVGSAIRVWMGSGDVLIPAAVHTYVLRYTMAGAVHDLDGNHALAFSPIDPGWQFPILAVSVRVTLPAAARIVDTKARVGTVGGPLPGAWTRPSPNIAVFKARTLPDEDNGLSIVVAFAGGIEQAARSHTKLDN